METNNVTCATCGFTWSSDAPVEHSCITVLLERLRNQYSGVLSHINPTSLAVGDVVRRVNATEDEYITDVLVADDGLAYSVNGCAWYDLEELTFVRRANDESLSVALKLLSDDGDEDIEEDEEASRLKFNAAWDDATGGDDIDGDGAGSEDDGSDGNAGADDVAAEPDKPNLEWDALESQVADLKVVRPDDLEGSDGN